VLRPFPLADAPRVQQFAGAREVALNTLTIPHPYPDGAAEEWIESHDAKFAEGTINFAIDDGDLVGAIGLPEGGLAAQLMGNEFTVHSSQENRSPMNYELVPCEL